MSAQIRDLCPVHGEPMWWWPTGGEWACQRPTCEATTPVTQSEAFAAMAERTRWLYRSTLLATPPAMFGSPFRIVSTA